MLKDFYIDVIVLPLLFAGAIRFAVKKMKIRKSYYSFAVLFMVIDAIAWSIDMIVNSDINDMYSIQNTIFINCLLLGILFLVYYKCYKNVNVEMAYLKKNTKLLSGFILILSMATFYFIRWYDLNFSYITFDALLYTITAPTAGTANEMYIGVLLRIIVPLVVFTFIAIVWMKKEQIHLFTCASAMGKMYNHIGFICVIVFASFVSLGTVRLGIVDFFMNIDKMSSIYEDYYVSPQNINIEIDNDNKHNLILIYLESMETTYADNNNGGVNDINYIPNLTKMIKENISFSNNNDCMGGFSSCSGTVWTMAATISTTAGINFLFPIGRQDLANRESIAQNAITLGDILKENGYYLEVLMGSDAEFAGEGKWFSQHGDYKVFDLNSIRKSGYVAEDFYEWWGVRDEIVYQVAKDRLAKISKENESFAFSMFTMDTHCTGGYVCGLCESKYDYPLGDVLECADKQVYEFVEWCKKQEFYNDTTIVLIGDHPRMDKYLVGDLQPNERRIYNCFINPIMKNECDFYNRNFTSLDLFPTILSSVGFSIEGNRLGLGTNMFSEEKTIAEKKGIDWMNEELEKNSNYYISHFY